VNLLALDTSSLACTVGLQFEGQMFTRYEEKPREHTQLLMPMIRSVLDEAKIDLQELDAIVLGNGPGSFIGMRIGASVAQGLAYGAGLKIVPVSSMAVVAAEVAAREAVRVVVAQDAHMQEVYLGIYDAGPEAAAWLIEERLQPCDKIAELDDGQAYVAAGFGWQRFPELLEANRDNLARVSEVLYPNARYLLKLGAVACQQGESLAPEDVVPAYLRQKVAEKPKTPRP
jgi:tRNA threonylcarbamoyladenosine biosynthesis protein TsaB